MTIIKNSKICHLLIADTQSITHFLCTILQDDMNVFRTLLQDSCTLLQGHHPPFNHIFAIRKIATRSSWCRPSSLSKATVLPFTAHVTATKGCHISNLRQIERRYTVCWAAVHYKLRNYLQKDTNRYVSGNYESKNDMIDNWGIRGMADARAVCPHHLMFSEKGYNLNH